MKKMKILIIIMVILIILFSVLLYFTIQRNNSSISNSIENVNANTDNLDEQENNKIYTETEHTDIDEYSDIGEIDYFTLEHCIVSFFDTINRNNSLYYGAGGQKISTDEEINSLIIKLLSNEYINKNNITSDNVDKYVYNFDKEVLFVPIQVRKFYEKNQVNSFVIKGLIEDLEYTSISEVMLIVNVDTTNDTYSVEIIKNYSTINSITPTKLDKIEKNNNNTCSFITFNHEKTTIEEITSLYKKTALGYPELFYNSYLNTNYKNNRFKNLEDFKKYIENNKDIIKKINIKKYKKINNDNGSSTYILEDQYENIIIVEYKSIVDYKVYLDKYTVELDIFKEEYNNSKDDESKLSIQLGKITQMLNNKDYNAIYNKLNETFRNNNFTNVPSLEEYLKNNIYNINSVVISDYEKNDDYYVCKATIINQENTNESKDINLIIKLIDSNNFEMSFSFEE